MIRILCFEQSGNFNQKKRDLSLIENASADYVFSFHDLKDQLAKTGYDLLVFFTDPEETETNEFHLFKKTVPIQKLEISNEIVELDLISNIQKIIEKKFQTELQSVLSRFGVLREVMEKNQIFELSKMFEMRLDPYLQTVHSAVLLKEKSVLSFQMHTLKSLSANIGGLRLTQLCEYLENQKSNDFHFEIPCYVQCIFLEFRNLINVLKTAEKLFQS